MFEYCAPKDVNVDGNGIVRFLDDMTQKKLHMHSIIILRHGKIIFEASFEPWSKDKKHMLFSLSKSFTSTAVGFAVQDGLLKTSDRLIDFFPELLTNSPCENMQHITVKHMLTMNTGHGQEPMHIDENWERCFLRSYIEFEPGTHFMYNTYATYMLSAIVQKVTGKKLVDYLIEKLFTPLEMSEDIWTEESPTGVATGGYGLNVRTMDIAKLGQFDLQKGKWNGVQLLNEQWIKDAQTPWSDNSPTGGDSDWGRGYGYQFWMCTSKHIFRGDGAFGQYCIICPDQDMVIAINSGVTDMGAVMRSIWDNVLPGVDAPSNNDASQLERLKYCVTPACWEEASDEYTPPVVNSEWIGKYRLNRDNHAELESIEVKQDCVCLNDQSGKDICIPLCLDTWQHIQTSEASLSRLVNHSDLAVRAATVNDCLILHICYTNTPFEDVLKLSFSEHGIVIDGQRNVGFGDGKFEVIGYKL